MEEGFTRLTFLASLCCSPGSMLDLYAARSFCKAWLLTTWLLFQVHQLRHFPRAMASMGCCKLVHDNRMHGYSHENLLHDYEARELYLEKCSI